MKNVWASSATGVSIATITLPSAEAADELITGLFRKTLIADVSNFEKVRKVYRISLTGSAEKNHKWEEIHRLQMVTSDERVPELIEECVDITKNEKADIIIRQLSGISHEYSKWVGLQTTEESEAFRVANSGITTTIPQDSKEYADKFSPQSRQEMAKN